MLRPFLRGSTAVAGLLIASAVHAQGPRLDPLDPRAAVPPVLHRSSLHAYRPATEVPVGSWKDANDTVTRIGGWRAYAREAAQPEPAAPATVPAMTPPTAPAPEPTRSSGGAGHGHGQP